MTQMPRFDSQVSAERMRTRSRPESSIFWASSSAISVPAWTMISPVNGSRMSSAATRPSTRSRSDWMMSPPSTSGAASMYLTVPQSYSETMTSCDTSTRRRVRYPESAVLSAVSARPLRAPWVEVKYSSTVSPSRKFEVIGVSMISPEGLAMRPRMPELPDLLLRAAGARIGHHVDGVELAALLAALELGEHGVGDLLGHVRPDVHNLVVPLSVGDDAVLVLLLDLVDLLPRPVDELALGGRDVHVLDPDAEAGEGCVAEPDVLQLVEEGHGRLVAEAVVAVRDEDADLLLLELLVDEAQGGGDDVVEEGAAHRRLDDAAVPAQTDPRLEVDVLVVVRDAHLFGVGEEPPFTLGAGALLGQVVDAEDHILGGNGHGGPVRGGQDVVRRQHQHLRLHLGLHGERHVHGHLVAVEVRVERGAHERADLDCLALDQDGLEGLDAQAVERRRAVQEHRMLGDHFFQDVPDLRPLLLHELLGRLDGGGDAPLLELAKDEGLEELEGHLLGQPALVELEVGADHDDGAPGIVHPLAEQVLAEAALLALQGVGQGLEGPVVRPRDNAAAAAVVEEGVHRFLQHPLLVADDDLGS